MTTRSWTVFAAGVLTVLALQSGCTKSEPAKAPPGVTKEMEQVAPPTIDFGSPAAKPNLPAAKDEKAK